MKLHHTTDLTQFKSVAQKRIPVTMVTVGKPPLLSLCHPPSPRGEEGIPNCEPLVLMWSVSLCSLPSLVPSCFCVCSLSVPCFSCVSHSWPCFLLWLWPSQLRHLGNFPSLAPNGTSAVYLGTSWYSEPKEPRVESTVLSHILSYLKHLSRCVATTGRFVLLFWFWLVGWLVFQFVDFLLLFVLFYNTRD